MRLQSVCYGKGGLGTAGEVPSDPDGSGGAGQNEILPGDVVPAVFFFKQSGIVKRDIRINGRPRGQIPGNHQIKIPLGGGAQAHAQTEGRLRDRIEKHLPGAEIQTEVCIAVIRINQMSHAPGAAGAADHMGVSIRRQRR